ncbi:hypothetical protein DFA_05175 [Cavenderia fasciculata]|uniref:MACPF domain-containing protein n=1 Tax=Cavenderia fasciculata TaxID=261658 RepID=F4PNJ2_CACFS|nr:uncharacterized protein DFA_05175 [Cavenderia fasciculata]EGG23045.1 hypothetical protein DFA_05175 [Cavenderia fasciculata]|eukprot:XP_004360896.1 hypothetical protein DFA_05175 [Cavenderia fasciculata]
MVGSSKGSSSLYDVNDINSFTTTTTTSIQQGLVTVYVDNRSKCIRDCGNQTQPFVSIRDALVFLQLDVKVISSAKILVEPGVYDGINNKELDIANGLDLEISVVHGQKDVLMTLEIPKLGVLSSMVVIKCDSIGRAFRVSGPSTKLSINGLAIVGCSNGEGGGIVVEDGATLITMSTIFTQTQATIGAALSLRSSSAHLTNTLFFANSYHFGTVISSVGSRVVFTNSHAPCDPDDPLPRYIIRLVNDNDQVASFYPDDDSTIGHGLSAVYNENFIDSPCALPFCRPPIQTNGQCSQVEIDSALAKININTVDPLTISRTTCNSNGVCDHLTEDCFACPSDCSCVFANTYLLHSQSSASVTSNQRPTKMLSLPVVSGANQGHLLFYVRPEHKNNHLLIEVEACAVTLTVNGKQELVILEGPHNNYQHLLRIANTTSTSRFQVDFKCNTVNKNSSFSIKYRDTDNDDFRFIDGFYSINSCNDGILNQQEAITTSKFYCPQDIGSYVDFSGDGNQKAPRCSDNQCNEIPDECPIDCYTEFAKNCRELASPSNIDNRYKKDEFLGALLNNQYLYALPGIDAFSHGIDILTGKSKDTRIFHFGYCDDEPFSTIHDNYRGLVYTIPYGLSGVPAPKCSYESSSTIYSASFQMADEMSQETSLDASVSASGGFWGISIGASVAYSQDRSVQMAREMEQTSSKTFIVSKAKCSVSKVVLTESETKFHLLFLKDLVNADTLPKMVVVIARYGTAYLKNAVMGGKIRLMTTISNEFASKSTESELQQNAALSLSVQASSPIGSASVSGSGQSSGATSAASQSEFNRESTHSQIMTDGGSPGAFSPDEFGANTFSDWASSVDLRPVPIQSEWGYISDLIPSDWKVAGSTTKTIKNLWRMAEFTSNFQAKTSKPVDSTIATRVSNRALTYLLVTSTASDAPLNDVFTLTFAQPSGSADTVSVTMTTPNRLFWFSAPDDTFKLAAAPTVGHHIIDILTSRVYTFDPLVGTLPVAPTPGLIEVRISDLSFVPTMTGQIAVTVFGSRGSHKILKSFPFPDGSTFALYNFVLQTDGQLGDLVSLKLEFLPELNQPANRLINFKYYNVVQHCSVNINKADRICKPNAKMLYNSGLTTTESRFLQYITATRMSQPLHLALSPIIRTGTKIVTPSGVTTI